MRDISFRAWDKERGVMIPSVGFTDCDCGRLYVRERYMVDDGGNGESRHWIPMQSTGLNDKNGKRIYEGDVVTAFSMPDVNLKVYWDEHSARFANIPYPNEQEIIGNIYENPELLTPKDDE